MFRGIRLLKHLFISVLQLIMILYITQNTPKGKIELGVLKQIPHLQLHSVLVVIPLNGILNQQN